MLPDNIGELTLAQLLDLKYSIYEKKREIYDRYKKYAGVELEPLIKEEDIVQDFINILGLSLGVKK